jgi:hypothetical protein
MRIRVIQRRHRNRRECSRVGEAPHPSIGVRHRFAATAGHPRLRGADFRQSPERNLARSMLALPNPHARHAVYRATWLCEALFCETLFCEALLRGLVSLQSLIQLCRRLDRISRDVLQARKGTFRILWR